MIFSNLQKLILNWFDHHGRKNLPWQHNKTPYRVWISEIMLQQTQVSTVIPYFEKFIECFPDLPFLAQASQDQVMHLWAGLGYYRRARNLHRAAKIVMEEYDGEFPQESQLLQQLPGIGRSTANAILAIAFNQATAILDGNVKRVLCRFYGITDSIMNKKIENKLWQLADFLMPAYRCADYTQAMMDLGATICTRNQPQCSRCPLIKKCVANRENITEFLPKKNISKLLPVRSSTFFILQKDKTILLQKREPLGIWGGLWSFPEMMNVPTDENIRLYCQENFRITKFNYHKRESFRHTFSHFHLNIFPVVISIKRLPAKIMEANQQIWYDFELPLAVGLPQPVQKIIRELIHESNNPVH